ncbi:hypothetical protein BsWGS_12550 [Bradybaena similaris]
MEMDRAHASEAAKHHQTGIEVEPPQGKRKRGCPRNTWRRGLEADTTRMGYTWSQLERIAQDRGMWRTAVSGPYPDKDEGHE